MTEDQIKAVLGIKTIRRISPDTVVVEFPTGAARPVTVLELRMWDLLRAGALRL